MRYETHLLFAFFCSIICITQFKLGNSLIIIFLVLIASFIPDIDHPNSFLGKRLKPISWIFNKVFQHRGFFHSILFTILLYFILLFFLDINYAIAIIIGYLSHILLDSLSEEGITLFYPLKKPRIRGIIKTGGTLEVVLQWTMIVAIVLMMVMFNNFL